MGAALTVTALNVARPGGGTLLHVDTLDINAGALIGITGPSGAGKSTFLFAIAGLLDGVAGSVAWDGQDILSLKPEARAAFRRDQVGMVFQDHMLFDEMSALGNAAAMALFRPKSQRAGLRNQAQAMLTHLGVPDRGGKVSSFSGGERQRIAVARAIAADAPVILLDEPTASLDKPTGARLIRDLADLARRDGKTVILVSHDTVALDAMDQVLTLVDGRLQA